MKYHWNFDTYKQILKCKKIDKYIIKIADEIFETAKMMN